MAIDRTHPENYPPNIQAILKRQAPAAAILGQEILDVDKAQGFVRVAYNTTQSLSNRYGAIHGGMTAAMMDDVISLAAGLSIEWGQITPTLEMKVNYIAQGKPETRLIAEARTVRRGSTVIFFGSGFERRKRETYCHRLIDSHDFTVEKSGVKFKRRFQQ